MKILVVADEVSPSLYHGNPRERFPEIHCIVSCGDLPTDYLDFLASSFNVPCFFISGNHDQRYIESPPPGWVSLDGKIIVHDSIRFMGLGGSMRYNQESDFQYTESQMWWRYMKLLPQLWRHLNQIDVLVTHAPAFELGDGDDLAHQGFKVFRTILHNHQPRFFLHGHVHLNCGGIREQHYGTTRIINGFQHVIIDIEHPTPLKRKHDRISAKI